MAPLGIRTKLHFINGQKIAAHPFGHRLDRAHPILRTLWHDAFFAGDQSHNRRPAHRDDLVVNLARKQAQRQADNASAMAQHPLDRVMRFTGVGGA